MGSFLCGGLEDCLNSCLIILFLNRYAVDDRVQSKLVQYSGFEVECKHLIGCFSTFMPIILNLEEAMQNPMDILETVRGFMKSRVILTGAELDLFTQIHRGVDTVDELAERNRLNTRAITRLLDALVVYGLLTKNDGRYRLSPQGLFLSADQPDTVLPMVLHMNELWDSWSQLTQAVSLGKNSHSIPISEKSEVNQKAFIGAMHVVGRKLSEEIAEYLDLSPYRNLLDVGGASGTYTIAFLNQNPKMSASIFDLKQVIPLAEARLTQAGMHPRVKLIAGDFYTDPLPQGYDLALLSAIIHQNSPAQNQALYRKIYHALLPGGTIIIRDHIMEESRTVPPAGAVFALNMLVATAAGDTYTFSEIEETLKAAGFSNIRQIRSGERMDGIISARKPG